MAKGESTGRTAPELLVSSRDYFRDVVQDALEQRKVKTYPVAADYLVSLLEHYMSTNNLYDEKDDSGRCRRETLAEMFLRAANSAPNTRISLLKKLGDTSLYVSGFFGESLQRKIIDVDYYAEMGGTAYGALAGCVREDTMSHLFKEFSARFQEFVDVLTYISTKTFVQNEDNLLRLYERYTKTGSNLAREQLAAKGIFPVPNPKKSNGEKQ